MDDQLLEERHQNYGKRMDSHSVAIKERITWRVFFWTLGIGFVLIFGSYGYTKTVADDMSGVVTKNDMATYQKAIIDAIKAGK